MFKITLKFLEAVQRNNTTERLHTHWDLYQQEKKRFMEFNNIFLQEAKKLNPALEDLEIKNCIYRFNKDLRFSKDGKPYKENFWAVFAYGGRKTDFPAFYFHLQPWASFLGGWIYMPLPKHEIKIRTHLLKNFHRWEALLAAPKFKKYYGQPRSEHYYKSTYKLKQLMLSDTELLEHMSPVLQEYGLDAYAWNRPLWRSSEESSTILNQLAYFKDWIFDHRLKDQEVLNDNLLKEILSAYKLLLPMLEFLEEAYE